MDNQLVSARFKEFFILQQLQKKQEIGNLPIFLKHEKIITNFIVLFPYKKKFRKQYEEISSSSVWR